jgi:hypothetical protein
MLRVHRRLSQVLRVHGSGLYWEDVGRGGSRARMRINITLVYLATRRLIAEHGCGVRGEGRNAAREMRLVSARGLIFITGFLGRSLCASRMGHVCLVVAPEREGNPRLRLIARFRRRRGSPLLIDEGSSGPTLLTVVSASCGPRLSDCRPGDEYQRSHKSRRAIAEVRLTV